MVAAILTGGRARRFHGRDKSRLVIDGRPILERQLELVGPVVSETLIVTSAARAGSFASFPRAFRYPVRTVVDRYPDTGPLGAIVTALEAAGDAVFVLAGDMPAVTLPLVEALQALHARHAAAVTVPASSRGLEPLCAIYDRAALLPLRTALDENRLAVHAVLASIAVRILPVEEVARLGDPGTIFRNVNTPADLTR